MQKIIVHIDADLQDIVPLFLQSRADDVQKLQSALQAARYDEMYVIAHNLAGTGAGYGFETISDIGRQMCDAIKAQKLDGLPTLIEQLQSYLSAVEVVYRSSK
ncbi:MAG: Hpt domain-containing protein [Chloroherpetonaceae bacterium]|nr:Hpt domain-containing protein [Chloroherpetonaceae bacterium]MCS7210334.1 Hpt domain-containing protein [Chloroherpetonaceae bacterium]MDW8019073.1 Hpt domain-containing protein [Chloroherpetonaceae bacterium]MDW8465541.1 Hpt domain-containing protein [Chloroherpetonaceae bacterium]